MARLQMAHTIQAYVLIPLVENAPYFPVFAFANDATNATATIQPGNFIEMSPILVAGMACLNTLK